MPATSTPDLEPNLNPIAHLNFTRTDYYVQFFMISPIPLVCLLSLYQSVAGGARAWGDLETIGLGAYFIISWLSYPLAFLAIQLMASRKINLRQASQKATSRILLKYLSTLFGYVFAIPLCPIGLTTLSQVKKYQELQSSLKAETTEDNINKSASK